MYGLLQVLPAARPYQGNDIPIAEQHPCQRDLGRRHPASIGERPDFFHKLEVGLQVDALKARHVRPEVTGAEPVRPGDSPAEQAAGEHAVGDADNAQFAQGGQYLIFDVATEQGIFNLQGGNGVNGMGGAQAGGRRLGHAHVAYLAFADQVPQGADHVFQRHIRVHPGGEIKVYVVGVEAAQAVAEKVAYGSGPGVKAYDAAVMIALGAEFDRQEDLVTLTPDRLADQHFIVAAAVEIPRIDEIDAVIYGGPDRGDALIFIRPAVEIGHPHAAQADGGQFHAGGSMFSFWDSHNATHAAFRPCLIRAAACRGTWPCPAPCDPKAGRRR